MFTTPTDSSWFSVSFVDESDISSINLNTYTGIYFTPAIDGSTIICGNLDTNGIQYYYKISTQNNQIALPNPGNLSINVTGNSVNFSYSAIFKYLIDLHEVSAYDKYYARFFNSNKMLQPNMSFDGITNFSDLAYSLNNFIGHGIMTSTEYAYDDLYLVKSDDDDNKIMYSDIFTDTATGSSGGCIDDIELKSFRINILYNTSADNIPNNISYTVNGTTLSVPHKSAWTYDSVVIDGTTYSHAYINLSCGKTIFTTADLYNKISSKKRDLFNSFYQYVYKDTTNIGNIDNYDINAYYNNSSLFNRFELGNINNMPGVWTAASSTAESQVFYTTGYFNNILERRFFVDASLSGYKKYIDSSYGKTQKTIIDDVIFVPISCGDTSTGVHLFNSIFDMQKVISITLQYTDVSKLSNISFYIDSIVLNKSTNNTKSNVALCGNSNPYDSVTICGPTIANTYDALTENQPFKYNGEVKYVIGSDVTIKSTLDASGYNNGILSNAVQYLNNYVKFNVNITPSVEYVEDTIMIDGYTVDDFNGTMNNVLDYNIHVISIQVKNTTGAGIIISPEIFNIATDDFKNDDGDRIYAGYFIDEFNRTATGNDNEKTAFVTLPQKYITSGNFTGDSVMVKLNSSEFMQNKYDGITYDSSLFSKVISVVNKTSVKTDNNSSVYRISYIDHNHDRQQFWRLPADKSANIYYFIKKNSTKFASIFGIGLCMMPYYSDTYNYDEADRTIIMFNSRANNKLPTFIQTANASIYESKYMVQPDDNKSIININDEIDISASTSKYIIINRSTMEILVLPALMFSGAENFNADLDGLCIADNNLIVNLQGDSSGKYKYIKFDTIIDIQTINWNDINIA